MDPLLHDEDATLGLAPRLDDGEARVALDEAEAILADMMAGPADGVLDVLARTHAQEGEEEEDHQGVALYTLDSVIPAGGFCMVPNPERARDPNAPALVPATRPALATRVDGSQVTLPAGTNEAVLVARAGLLSNKDWPEYATRLPEAWFERAGRVDLWRMERRAWQMAREARTPNASAGRKRPREEPEDEPAPGEPPAKRAATEPGVLGFLTESLAADDIQVKIIIA